MACFGIECWNERGDAFAVAFNLFSRLSPLEYRAGAMWRRLPLAALGDLRPVTETAALLCTMIGVTSFDGFLNDPIWRSASPSLQRALRDVGLSGTAALELVLTFGLLASVAVFAALYRAGIAGMASAPARRRRALPRRHRGHGIAARAQPPRQLAAAFAHSLAPIAFGYLLAHYFSLLVTQGQATAYLISDPFGTGANLFGTASSAPPRSGTSRSGRCSAATFAGCSSPTIARSSCTATLPPRPSPSGGCWR
jgi:hypothetical protein